MAPDAAAAMQEKTTMAMSVFVAKVYSFLNGTGGTDGAPAPPRLFLAGRAIEFGGPARGYEGIRGPLARHTSPAYDREG